jgi:hypothetical protein
MKYKIQKLLLFVSLAVLASCASNKKMYDADVVITPLSGKINVSEGSLIYALPLTVLDIKLEVEHIIEKPGPYARFAEGLLGLKDVMQEEHEHWILREVTIKSHEEPDPSQFYVIETTSLFQTNALALKKAGLIMDINPDILNWEGSVNRSWISDAGHFQVSDLGADEYFQTKADTLYRIVNVDTAFIRIPYLIEKKQKLSTEELATKAAIRLMEMRDGKHLILTGEANVFPQDESPIAEMNRLEKEYTELFTGKTWRETRYFSFQVTPKKEMSDSKIIICKISDTRGPVLQSDKTGIPLVLELVPESKTQELSLIEKKQTGSSTNLSDRLYYRVPDMVQLNMTYGNEVFNTSRQLIYQYGNVIRLPSNFIIGK